MRRARDPITHLKVVVHWQDTRHSGGQFDLQEAKTIRSTEFSTIGFLVKRGRRDVVIAGDISEEGHYRDITTIPRQCINRIERL